MKNYSRTSHNRAVVKVAPRAAPRDKGHARRSHDQAVSEPPAGRHQAASEPTTGFIGATEGLHLRAASWLHWVWAKAVPSEPNRAEPKSDLVQSGVS
ncbi:hypothetical protein E3N88_13847 [Mikania micrantha]|uniref:Uncharacterized protein n=1 Tax=Mikania micrantha TaxID=192012 RepID=A0A5N6P0Z4_9ASTR|nr:hypothetical protein E3N88_13847 [Mikania micrantha]